MSSSSTSCSSSSSSSNSKPPVLNAKRGGGGGLQGARPRPLTLPTAPSSAATAAAARPSKKPRVSNVADERGPVVIYERTPKAVHVRPDEFMAVVQRLTGQQQPPAPSLQRLQAEAVVLPQTESTTTAPSLDASEEEETATAGDQLRVAFGRQEAPQLQEQYWLPGMAPSPGSDGFLLSPGVVLFSPATLQAIHELIS